MGLSKFFTIPRPTSLVLGTRFVYIHTVGDIEQAKFRVGYIS